MRAPLFTDLDTLGKVVAILERTGWNFSTMSVRA